MQFSQVLSASIVLAGSAFAQTATSASSAASASGSGGTTVHVVQVSDPSGALVYMPNAIQANPGDMVQFQFYPNNHSVVMSQFNTPCQPVDQASTPNAFFSGYMPVENKADGGRLTYSIMVKDTNPVWFYCSQGRHCQDGMVGVINPPSNSQQTIQAFASAAKSAANNVSPNGGSTAGQIGGTNPSGTGASPATTTNAASGMYAAAKDGFFGMAVAAAVAFMML